jgi:signal transduction histidine kinase
VRWYIFPGIREKIAVKKTPFVLSIVVGLIVTIICIYGFILLTQRTGLPPEIDQKNLVQVDDIELKNSLDIIFVLSQKSIGESSTFYLETEGKIEKKEAAYVPFYPKILFPLIYFIIGLFSLAVGILVFLFRSVDKRARIFYYASLTFASAIIISGGQYWFQESWHSYIPGVLFYLCYSFAPALFLHFSLCFSKIKIKRGEIFIYLPALIFFILEEATFLLSSLKSSIDIYRLYQAVMYAFRIYMLIYIFLSVILLIIRYKKILLEEEKAQIKWVFYGLCVGLGPFTLLSQLPRTFGLNPFISEEMATLFFVFVPLAFAFSIITFKLMDIELVINRSIVYSVLTVFTVSIYLFSILLFQNIFTKFFSTTETVVSVFGALLAAAAFHPARKKIQLLVDKAFFRISYDYKRSILSFNERAHLMVNNEHLANFFLLKVKKALPLEHLGISVFNVQSGIRKLLIDKNGGKALKFQASPASLSEKIAAREQAVRTEENIDFSHEEALEDLNLELVIPLSFRSAGLEGCLTIGKKKSGERFTHDDLELLLTMAGELSLNLERIRLQEEVFEERAEREKLSELNRLKTEFISSVSHELRTPMSSIQGLAETLQKGKIRDKAKQEELLNLVSSESSRLSQFIHNVLDFGKLEQQAKNYNFDDVALRPLIEEVVNIAQYRLEIEGFKIKTHLPKRSIILKIDTDAVKQVLTNLIDNAIKYSSDKKEIEIKVTEKKTEVIIQIRDKGIGIPLEEQDKIFEGFYRHDGAVKSNPKGVGLGLKIVRHIMKAHKGDVKVESEPDKGSTFSLYFPKP